MNNEEIISFYLDGDILISPELLSEIKDKPLPISSEFAVLDREIMDILDKKTPISVLEFERAIVMAQKHKDKKLYTSFLEYIQNGSGKDKEKEKDLPTSDKVSLTTSDRIDNSISNPIPAETTVRIKDNLDSENEKKIFMQKNKINILSSYNKKARKWSVYDFVNVYNSRLKELEKILRSRQELQNLTSISRINSKKEKENVAFVGVVYGKAVTKAGNLLFTIEDQTGMIKVVVTQRNESLFKLAEEIQLDEVIGVTGTCDQIVFANNLFIPDVPLTKELKKSPDDGYFAVISDLEVGNKYFLEKEFMKFISWINGDIGNEKQKEAASKIKYVFIVGDCVAGVGIYPGQEYDLTIIDIKDQYKKFAEYVSLIPSHIPVFICLGNHDVGRISEPQPPLTAEYAQSLVEIPNVIPVSNPSLINIFAQSDKGFGGLDVMLYHGGSLVYYSEAILNIRRLGAQKRPDLIMKYWLQRRHLAPTHTATLYIPDPEKDPLLIDKVPDFILSGHIHRASVTNYRNVTCINASCWGAVTEEQERRGLEPQPARAFLVDMHTREVKIMNFLSKEDQESEDKVLQQLAPAQVMPNG